jgi:hypothetical protein
MVTCAAVQYNIFGVYRETFTVTSDEPDTYAKLKDLSCITVHLFISDDICDEHQ